ncbi:hypothetical protein [Limnobacter litoralis]|uniref:hypothetical protein n=1 Tax=Limnobacter litoralis TaxID=481366 RepID=UPI0024E04FD1|nr:hypothetical protein [Limnobacter litoralis]
MKRQLVAWLRSSWLLLVFFLYGLYELWSLLAGEEQLSKAFIVKLVFLAFYTAFNLVAAVGFFIFELQMTFNGAVIEILDKSSSLHVRTNEVQREIVKAQRESLSLTKKAIDLHRPLRKPKR